MACVADFVGEEAEGVLEGVGKAYQLGTVIKALTSWVGALW